MERTMIKRENLLQRIRKFCETHNITEQTLGQYACQNRQAVDRVRRGTAQTNTLEKLDVALRKPPKQIGQRGRPKIAQRASR